MEKFNKSQKLLKWENGDYVKNVIVYFLNALIISALFFAFKYFAEDGVSLNETFNLKGVLSFTAVTIILVAVVFMYFYFEDRNFLKRASNSELIFFVVEVSLVICSLIGKYVNPFLRPFAVPVLLIVFLVNRKSAIFMNIIFCIVNFLGDSFLGYTWQFATATLLTGFVTGMIASFCMDKSSSRIRVLFSSAVISVPTVISVLLYLYETNWEKFLPNFLSGIFVGVVSGIIFLILLPVFEVMFGSISSFKLAELTDHKAKLIKRLIKEAPGTFNHSIVVSNIAEACAIAIDEDALLARACAYYHDVGKLRRPEFFGENQTDKNSPHADLMPELSASIIKSHAQDGYQLVLKNRLPKAIANVCLEHHGTTPILFFYDKAKKLTDGEVDIKEYSYAGPKPQSKISAIIMIADGCEAAVRSLKNRSQENVIAIVRKIVIDRMEMGQFDECDITIKELNIIIHTVVNNLTGIYHTRVEYPKIKLNEIDVKKDEE